MITTLCTPTYKAAYAARKAADKPNKSLPVTSHLLLLANSEAVFIVPFRWTEQAKYTEQVRARIDRQPFAVCVPAKPFIDWLRVTQLTAKEKKHATSDQIHLDLNKDTQELTIKAGNTRATFKCLDAGEWPAMEMTQ